VDHHDSHKPFLQLIKPDKAKKKKLKQNPNTMTIFHVVFISTPGIRNLIPLVEFAHLLVT
jgi:hypothetical protein